MNGVPLAPSPLNFTIYALDAPVCLPERPLLLYAIIQCAAAACGWCTRFLAYWLCGRQRSRVAVHSALVKEHSLGKAPRECGIATLSEGWLVYVVRLAVIVGTLICFILSGICLRIPLALAVVWVGSCAICGVAFTNFKEKEHGIAAAALVIVDTFSCSVLCANFVKYEPGVPEGTWAGLLGAKSALTFAFLSYPILVRCMRSGGKRPLPEDEATGVSYYLAVVEALTLSVSFTVCSLVTPATFPVGPG